MERPFDELDGVIATTSGYTGGFKDQPTYHEVGGGSTGHRESVQILYDPSKVSYETLLNVFWRQVCLFWLFLVIFGYFWLFLVIFGYFWLFLVIFGYFWLFLVIFGYFWLFPYGQLD